MPMDFTKTSKQFEASKNEIVEEAPTNEVINEGIDTIDIVEEMKMDNVDINTIAHKLVSLIFLCRLNHSIFTPLLKPYTIPLL